MTRLNYLSIILHPCSLPAIFFFENSLFKPRLQRVVDRLDPITGEKFISILAFLFVQNSLTFKAFKRARLNSYCNSKSVNPCPGHNLSFAARLAL